MRIGTGIFCQNALDWDRFEAEERGESVAGTPAQRDQEILLEEIGLAKLADELGFDSVWTVEHHFTPYTMVTNPLQLLSYIAGVTKNVDLATQVIVLPWHNPVRVAEDLIMLSGFLGEKRKVIAGVGRGLGRREYQGLNVDQNEARGRFEESVNIIQQLLRTGECSFKGEFYNIDKLRLRPGPTKDLSGMLRIAASSGETIDVGARAGVLPMVIPTQSLEKALVGFRELVARRKAYGYAPAHTKLALWAYVAETEEEARAGAERYMRVYNDTALRHYEFFGDHLKHIKGYESWAKRAEEQFRVDPATRSSSVADAFIAGHPWGTPDMVVDKMTKLANAFGADEFSIFFRFGGMTIEEGERNLRLFAEKVLPRMREVNAPPIESEETLAA